MIESPADCAGSASWQKRVNLIPLPRSYTFDRLAATTSTARLTAFIKADIRTRLKWRKQIPPSL